MPSLIRKRQGSRVSKRTGKRVEAVAYACQVPIGENEDGSTRYVHKTFELEREAKAWVAEIQRQAKDGGIVEPPKKRLAAYLDEWMENSARPSLRENTAASYVRIIDRYLKPGLGHVTLPKLNPGVIQAAYRKLETENGLSARSVRYAHSVLHNALDQAVKWRYLRRNPADGVTLPKAVKPEFNVLTPEEAGDLMTEGRRHRLGALLELALSTGMRPGEMLGLQWANVDLDEGTVRVVHTLTRSAGGEWKLNPPKTKHGRRTVPIPDQTVATLKAWRKRQAEERMQAGELWQGPHKPADGFVFTRLTGNPLEQCNTVQRVFKPTLRRLRGLQTQARELAEAGAAVAGIAERLDRPAGSVRRWIAADRVVPAGLRMYDLRHTHATLLLLAGVNPKVVSERLGHATVTITLDTYSHVLPNMQEDATQRLAGVLYGGGE